MTSPDHALLGWPLVFFPTNFPSLTPLGPLNAGPIYCKPWIYQDFDLQTEFSWVLNFTVFFYLQNLQK